MRVIVYLAILVWFLYGVPKKEWGAMSDAQRDEILDDVGQKGIQELQCDEVDVEVIFVGEWVLVYSECDETQYLAYRTGGDL